jgi:hypothetical protein
MRVHPRGSHGVEEPQVFFSASLDGGENEDKVRELHREVCRLGLNGNNATSSGSAEAVISGSRRVKASTTWRR